LSVPSLPQDPAQGAGAPEEMMASDTQETKADPAPKNETVAKSTPGQDVSKAEGGETTAAPSNYSRGEGQKPVTAAYRENWNAIFAKKNAKKKEKR
jgi:hypothetical protein